MAKQKVSAKAYNYEWKTAEEVIAKTDYSLYGLIYERAKFFLNNLKRIRKSHGYSPRELA